MTHWTETPLFHQVQEEAIALMRDAQLEIARIEATATPVGGPGEAADRLAVLRECSRTTARLTAVASWLLLQQAVAAGEVDGAFSHHPQMTLAEVPEVDPEDAVLRLSGLVSHSFLAVAADARDLYRRVHRLAHQQAAPP